MRGSTPSTFRGRTMSDSRYEIEFWDGADDRFQPLDTPFDPEELLREDGECRFPLIPFGDLRPSSEPSYLVKGLLPRVGLAVIWGPPKCGKSFWFFDLLLHVAL